MNSETKFKFLVIGAGLPRTGTLSTKHALEKLLPGICMHMITIISDIDESLKIFKDDVSDEELMKHFEKKNIVAGVDAPFITLYKKMVRLCPDAKVLLTVRDPEKWVISVKSTIGSSLNNFETFPYFLVKWVFPSFGRLRNFIKTDSLLTKMKYEINEGRGQEFYNQWVDSVKESVPKEKLLVFNVKEGWKPLCDFLNVPIPEGEFPRVNDTVAFRKKVRNIKNVIWVITVVMGALPVIIGCGLKYRLQFHPLSELWSYIGSWRNGFNAS